MFIADVYVCMGLGMGMGMGIGMGMGMGMGWREGSSYSPVHSTSTSRISYALADGAPDQGMISCQGQGQARQGGYRIPMKSN